MSDRAFQIIFGIIFIVVMIGTISEIRSEQGARWRYECQGLEPFVATRTGNGMVDERGRDVQPPSNCKRTHL